ncbi:MAG TPA: CVNH domain-containing protein [Candidatus Omnitrophota bacterium]|nr:CVNH domain-containing protein [Candidatus Omnitrophota bacterium]
MKKMLLAAAVAALFAVPALAANPPAGSYQKTCSNVAYDGTNLTASCKTFNGAANSTSLQYPTSCIGDIGNVNGVLACAGPNGSYALTCRNLTVAGTTLQGECQKRDGSWIPASLPNFQGFQGAITNCNGALQNGGQCSQ